ncbi:MAG: DoxX family protein [Candidatus Sericytochromatia bacterium]|nr:DoxX family protein [Candidatus Sericytochromatia bacterium]
MSPRIRTILYWLTTALAGLMLAGSGMGNLTRAPQVVEALVALGYPTYFPVILGSWKVLAAAALLAPGLPRLKEWAYAGVFFAMSGAVASHVLAGDPPAKALAPVVIVSIVLASWWLRPESRKLTAPMAVPAA